jgi:hypothetical protein
MADDVLTRANELTAGCLRPCRKFTHALVQDLADEVRDLRAKLDRRALDLGKFTQAAVTREKEREAEVQLLRDDMTDLRESRDKQRDLIKRYKAEVVSLRARLAATEVQRDTAWREADALRADLEITDAANESLLRRTRPAAGTRETPDE